MFACEEYRDRIQTFIEGCLSKADSCELRHHLALCSSCRADLEVTRKLHAILDSMEEADPPSSLIPEIMASIDRVTTAPVRANGLNIFKIMAIISGIISIPFMIWLLQNTIIQRASNYRVHNPFHDSFVIKLFLTIARSIASVFNDSPLSALASAASTTSPSFHTLMMIIGIIMASSIICSSLLILLSLRNRMKQEN